MVASRNVGCFLRLTWPSVHPSAFLVTHAESRYFQRNAIRTGCKPSLVMHGTSLNPLFIVDNHQNSFSRAFYLHVYGSSPQSESLEQVTLEGESRVSYKTIRTILS